MKQASAWGKVAGIVRQRPQTAQARCRHTAAARWEPCAEIGARDFERQDHAAVFDAQRPLIIRQFACKWPAVSRWADLDALAARAAAHQNHLCSTAPLLVPVEVGHSYADGAVQQVQADFQELLRFVKRFWLAPPPAGFITDPAAVHAQCGDSNAMLGGEVAAEGGGRVLGLCRNRLLFFF